MTDPYAGGNSVPPSPTTEVQPVPHVGTPAGHTNLPFTGGDVIGFTLIGLAAVAVGIFAARRKRRFAA